MGSDRSSGEAVRYCSWTKAIEHLGDRWSLLIVRQLGVIGPQGFNDLVAGLPGRVSRSVLADRLRRLETSGWLLAALMTVHRRTVLLLSARA